MKLADRLIPLQARYVRPLADVAEQRAWVPAPLGRGLRRIDGTCRIDSRTERMESASARKRVSVSHPIISRLYAKQAAKADELGLAQRRQQLLASLSGRVIEIGAGTGLNFAQYPSTVEEVLALEPESYLRKIAERAAADAPVPVRILDAPAEELPIEDGSFDAAVASLVLCSVADPATALSELYRAIRPGGELRFNEHLRSSAPARARLEQAADRLGWPHLSGGCHLARDTETLMRVAGFQIESLERYSFRIPPLDPPKTHIIGTARRPALRRSRHGTASY